MAQPLRGLVVVLGVKRDQAGLSSWWFELSRPQGLEMDGDVIQEARLALGGVAH